MLAVNCQMNTFDIHLNQFKYMFSLSIINKNTNQTYHMIHKIRVVFFSSGINNSLKLPLEVAWKKQSKRYLSRCTRKPTICTYENKYADQPAVQYCSDCTGRFVLYLVGNPDCWFSHFYGSFLFCLFDLLLYIPGNSYDLVGTWDIASSGMCFPLSLAINTQWTYLTRWFY